MSRIETVFHGEDKAAAIARAKRINGYAFHSKGPIPEGQTETDLWGYWSDPSGFIRSWESQVWPEEK